MNNEVTGQPISGPSVPLRLKLLPLAVALIGITTMVPVGLRRPSLSYVDLGFGFSDAALNILLYLPFGVAIGGSSLTRCFLSSFAISAFAETLQFGYTHRDPSPSDVVCNVCGALLGYLVATPVCRLLGLSNRLLTLPRFLAILCIPAGVLSVMAMVAHREKADFSNWDPTFQLAVGDELTGKRLWKGSISELAIYDTALDPALLRRVSNASADDATIGLSSISAPPLFRLQSSAPASYGQPLLTEEQQRSFFGRLVTRNQMSILVRLRTEKLWQAGPARIVTYSKDAYNRNFTLGQLNRSLVFRLRTPVSGLNGGNPDVTTRPLLALGRDYVVAAVYDGAISRLYVNGVLWGQADLAAKQPRLPSRIRHVLSSSFPVLELELNIIEFCIGALLAMGVLGVWPNVRRSTVDWVAVLTAAAAGTCIGIATGARPSLVVRFVVLSAAGALMIIASARQQDQRKKTSAWYPAKASRTTH